MTVLRSGQVAAQAGVNLQTLRYYERRGLITEPMRSLGGHRLYPADTVTVLRVIKAAQRLGFTLNEVSELLDAGRHRHGAEATVSSHARNKLIDVEAKIADLTLIRDTLLRTIEAGCDDPMRCAITPRCPLPFEQLGSGRQPADAARW